MGAINKFMNMLNIGSNEDEDVEDYDDEQEAEDAIRSHVSNVRQTIKDNYYYLV